MSVRRAFPLYWLPTAHALVGDVTVTPYRMFWTRPGFLLVCRRQAETAAQADPGAATAPPVAKTVAAVNTIRIDLRTVASRAVYWTIVGMRAHRGIDGIRMCA
jgi:hypothetical protein